MRPVPSSMNHRGEFGSPHISRMDGDLKHITPLGRDTTSNDDENDAMNNEENINSSREQNSGSTPMLPNLHSEDAQLAAPNSQQQHAAQPGGNSHEPHPTWSNVVSAGIHVPYSQINGITKSVSGETLPTSNKSQPPTKFEYFHQRSHSFSENESRSDMSTPDLSKSYSFENPSIAPLFSHPPPLPHKDATGPQHLPTIPQGVEVEGPTTPLHSPMIYSSPNGFAPREFKSRQHPALSYSPLSLDEATDQTSPMSSPSLSPHMAPLQLPKPRNHGGGSISPGPPMWQLSPPGPNPLNSDANEFHSESSLYLNHFHSHQPQSIPEYHQGPVNHVYGHHHHSYMTPFHHHAGPNGQNYHPYMVARPYNSSPSSPSKHSHSSAVTHHHHHSLQSRRPASKFNSGSAPQSPMSRSSTEILKTLLRKKACLYEPETSSAISLVTWLVGRRLALSQGFFTRQQLQSGVHSCVRQKIEEGHVTRTKVNRCMQIILNSCFHYIIPRPDGSEESGSIFRLTFSREISDDEHLLESLTVPWNGLSLDSLVLDDSCSHSLCASDDEVDQNLSGKNTGNESTLPSHGAGDSVDSGGKRAVLLCFNENIRSAADVFRCHNEFIRDVACTANLTLSPEEWQSFFSGTKVYRKRSVGGGGPASRHFVMADMYDRMDQHGLSKFRTTWCAKRYEHDQLLCSFAHVDMNKGWLRRDPFVYNYKPIMCPYVKPVQDTEECYFNMCQHGVECNHAHSREEILYHPENYKHHQCKSNIASCPLRDICPSMHANKQSGPSSDIAPHQSQGYNRYGKRYQGDHASLQRVVNPVTKRRISATAGSAAGFKKHPGGSPMLYIDPAPLSEFEKTLILPGLQAIFRDHSSSIFYACTKENSPCEYGIFGYRCIPQKENKAAKTPIGEYAGCAD